MPSDDLVTSQFNLDLFGNTALTPADLAPVGLIRIPMKEAPATEPDVGAQDTDSNAPPTNSIGTGFRLDGDRGLAQGWKNRALDNIAAIRLAAEIEGQGRAVTAEEQARLVRFCAFSSSDLAQSVFRRMPGAFREGWGGHPAGPWRGWCHARSWPGWPARPSMPISRLNFWSVPSGARLTGFGLWRADRRTRLPETGLFIAPRPAAICGSLPLHRHRSRSRHRPDRPAALPRQRHPD